METGNSSTKPNFKEMGFWDLRAYVVEHRDDEEAIHELFINRRNPNAQSYSSSNPKEIEDIIKRKIAGELRG